jgi:protoporphyrinogen oxidase
MECQLRKHPLFHCAYSLQDVQPINPLIEKQRIVIIGAGPTGLGAAQRMLELGIMRSESQLIILEQESAPGGLATSRRDDEGFLWDMGGHVVFSHYHYFDKSLDRAVQEWNKHKRAAFAFMKGSDNERRFIPYPVQENINAMSKEDGERCLEGLEEVVRNPSKRKPANFDEWLLMNFGKELCDIFMRKYNRKVWTVDAVDMNAAWVGERVAVPDIEKIRAKISSGEKPQDSSWGPNQFFRFPRHGGTGSMWKAIANRLPQGWFYFNQTVTGLNIKDKILHIVSNNDKRYSLKYDILLNTSPLDMFLRMNKDTDPISLQMKTLAENFVYSHTHVLGVGLKGQPPAFLEEKLLPGFGLSILQNHTLFKVFG